LPVNRDALYTQPYDGPFNVITFLGLFDVNGAPLYGPFATGYNAFLIAKYGGYHGSFDARSADYSAPTSGLFRFWFYIPVEIVKRNALGSLANLNAAATYKLQITLGTAASPYSTQPGPTPPMRLFVVLPSEILSTARSWPIPTRTPASADDTSH